MREILFRAWDKENKEMLDIEDLHWDNCTREFSIRTTMYRDYFDIEDMILMQYTGLKDKNGKEIYEGDIVKIDNDVASMFNIKSVGKVEYNNGLFLVRNGNGDEISILSSLFILADIKYCLRGEVIGNIYENPNLLEKENK